MRKRLLVVMICALAVLYLAGCAKEQEIEPLEEVEEEELPPDPTFTIQFGGEEIRIPKTLAIYHKANTMPSSAKDVDAYYFDKAGTISDVGVIRIGSLSGTVSDTSAAGMVIKDFSTASLYNAQDIVYSETILTDPFYYGSAITTEIETDITYMIFSLVPKNTNRIYSFTFLTDEDENLLLKEDELKVLFNSMQVFTGAELQENFLYTQFLHQMEKWVGSVSTEVDKSAPYLKDEQEYVIESDLIYRLDTKTGIYDLYVEGETEGEIVIIDARFGTRKALMGYDSANAPAVIKNITLCKGGVIKTEQGLSIKIRK